MIKRQGDDNVERVRIRLVKSQDSIAQQEEKGFKEGERMWKLIVMPLPDISKRWNLRLL